MWYCGVVVCNVMWCGLVWPVCVSGQFIVVHCSAVRRSAVQGSAVWRAVVCDAYIVVGSVVRLLVLVCCSAVCCGLVVLCCFVSLECCLLCAAEPHWLVIGKLQRQCMERTPTRRGRSDSNYSAEVQYSNKRQPQHSSHRCSQRIAVHLLDALERRSVVSVSAHLSGRCVVQLQFDPESADLVLECSLLVSPLLHLHRPLALQSRYSLVALLHTPL